MHLFDLPANTEGVLLGEIMIEDCVDDGSGGPTVLTPEVPSRIGNTVTVPVVDGVMYVDAEGAALSGPVVLGAGESLTITAVADDGHELAAGTWEWLFSYVAPGDRSDENPALDLSVSSIAAGGELTITVTGAQPHEELRLELHSTPVHLGTVTANAGGSATLHARIPVDADLGDHTIVVIGDVTRIEAAVRVTAAEGSEPTGSESSDGTERGSADATEKAGEIGEPKLAVTGFKPGVVFVAAATLVVGAGLLAIRRSRARV